MLGMPEVRPLTPGVLSCDDLGMRGRPTERTAISLIPNKLRSLKCNGRLKVMRVRG